MFILDFNQISLANLHMQLKNHTNAKLDENMLRHMVLNSIRAYNLQFRGQYGELIIACDDRISWRKDMFPYYKCRRKITRDKSELDWSTIFDSLTKIRHEIDLVFPYRVIGVGKAEADDVIATLCHKFGDKDGLAINDPILIISGDKDFKQLLAYSNVKIYHPTEKKYVNLNETPQEFLTNLIMRGDSGDDVPNILSQDDSFATGTRQKQLRTTKIDELLSMDRSQWPEHVQRNWHRNNALINLWEVPEWVQHAIMSKYEQQAGKKKANVFNYLIENRLTKLMESVSEF